MCRSRNSGWIRSGVALFVIAKVLLLLMELPVLLKVTTCSQRAKSQDRFRTMESPAGAGDSQSIIAEVATGPLDDTSCDGKALR